jgi:hypothetical protein
MFGLLGILYEAVIYDGEPRWPLLTVYITLLGLPGALGLDALKERLTAPAPPPPPGPSGPPSLPPVEGPEIKT